MLQTVKCAKAAGAAPRAVLGFRNQGAVILEEDFRAVCETFVTTDDGSYARHGFVTDVLKELVADATGVAACGPKPMLKAIAAHRKAGRPALSGVDGGAHGLRHRRVPRVRLRAQGGKRRDQIRARLQGRPGV